MAEDKMKLAARLPMSAYLSGLLEVVMQNRCTIIALSKLTTGIGKPTMTKLNKLMEQSREQAQSEVMEVLRKRGVPIDGEGEIWLDSFIKAD